jgi:hypothetical protein
MTSKTNIATWNANGLMNKKHQLLNFIQHRNIDIMLINETKLKRTQKFTLRGFSIIRKDRADNSGAGGVLALIKNNIPHAEITLRNNTMENICFKLTDNTYIISIYNRPQNHFTHRDLNALLGTSNKVLIIGDFNAKHSNWNCNRNNTNGTTLNDYITENNITIYYPDTPTHYPPNGNTPSTIDIIINKQILNISQPQSLPELDSDHNPVTFTLNENNKQNHYKRIISYKNTNWDEFRKTLDKNVKINNNINTTDDIESETKKLAKAIIKTRFTHTETININTINEKLPGHIIHIIKTRNQTRKLWQRTALPQHRTEMNRLTAQIRLTIKEHKNEQWTQTLEKLKPTDNSLWVMTKALKKTRKPIPALTHDNKTLITDSEKTEAIAEAFERVHNTDVNNHTQEQATIITTVQEYLQNEHITDQNTFTKILTTPHEIKQIIKTLPNNKAPGPDTIDNKTLKNINNKTVAQLTYIINAILKLNYFPNTWKHAIVIPIHKPNKNSKLPNNYRPISLLNTLAKITEKIILRRINNIDKKHNITTHCQFGFRPKHNTTHQLARITNDIIINYNKHNTTAMTLLDIQKAFDTVWIEGLLYKLIQYQFPQNIIKLLHSYLTNRKFTVKINNTYSTLKTPLKGVPQGSILGPKLFTLFINDIPTFPQTKLALYADDTAIYAHSFNAQVANKQIQIHLDILTKFYTKWKININPEKTENIIFTKKFTNNKIFTPIKINNTTITPTKTVKYLGMYLDTRLTHKIHIKNTINKAYALMKTLYPLMAKNSKLNSKNKKLIYTTIIRPLLTYAAPIWCNISKTALIPLQRYQNKCLRLITNSDRYTRITDLHDTAQIDTMQDYITKTSEKYYDTLSKNNINPLLNNITQIRYNNAPFVIKHKLLYQKLLIFNKNT